LPSPRNLDSLDRLSTLSICAKERRHNACPSSTRFGIDGVIEFQAASKDPSYSVECLVFSAMYVLAQRRSVPLRAAYLRESDLAAEKERDQHKRAEAELSERQKRIVSCESDCGQRWAAGLCGEFADADLDRRCSLAAEKAVEDALSLAKDRCVADFVDNGGKAVACKVGRPDGADIPMEEFSKRAAACTSSCRKEGPNALSEARREERERKRAEAEDARANAHQRRSGELCWEWHYPNNPACGLVWAGAVECKRQPSLETMGNDEAKAFCRPARGVSCNCK